MKSLTSIAFCLTLVFTSVTALKCVKCNSLQHGEKCGSNATLSLTEADLIVDCPGTCRVNKITAVDKEDVHLRDCLESTVTGCQEKNFTRGPGVILPAKLCHCDQDLCNVDWEYSASNKAFHTESPSPVAVKFEIYVPFESRGNTIFIASFTFLSGIIFSFIMSQM